MAPTQRSAVRLSLTDGGDGFHRTLHLRQTAGEKNSSQLCSGLPAPASSAAAPKSRVHGATNLDVNSVSVPFCILLNDRDLDHDAIAVVRIGIIGR